VKRSITGFHSDEESDWVADLDCGHGQHVRHDPPFTERSWVATPEGRRSRIGANLDCSLCDRGELPDGYAPYRRTPDFSEQSVPAALLADHSTKRGVWGLIHVSSGRLEYHVQSPPERSEVVVPGTPGVIAPEVKHRVACPEPVAFFVEFWRPAPSGGRTKQGADTLSR
jgi:tellurite methyltransferase